MQYVLDRSRCIKSTIASSSAATSLAKRRGSNAWFCGGGGLSTGLGTCATVGRAVQSCDSQRRIACYRRHNTTYVDSRKGSRLFLLKCFLSNGILLRPLMKPRHDFVNARVLRHPMGDHVAAHQDGDISDDHMRATRQGSQRTQYRAACSATRT